MLTKMSALPALDQGLASVIPARVVTLSRMINLDV